MLFVAMRSGRMLPRVRCNSVSIAIVPHDHGAMGGVVLYGYAVDYSVAGYRGTLFLMVLVCCGYGSGNVGYRVMIWDVVVYEWV